MPRRLSPGKKCINALNHPRIPRVVCRHQGPHTARTWAQSGSWLPAGRSGVFLGAVAPPKKQRMHFSLSTFVTRPSFQLLVSQRDPIQTNSTQPSWWAHNTQQRPLNPPSITATTTAGTVRDICGPTPPLQGIYGLTLGGAMATWVYIVHHQHTRTVIDIRPSILSYAQPIRIESCMQLLAHQVMGAARDGGCVRPKRALPHSPHRLTEKGAEGVAVHSG